MLSASANEGFVPLPKFTEMPVADTIRQRDKCLIPPVIPRLVPANRQNSDSQRVEYVKRSQWPASALTSQLRIPFQDCSQAQVQHAGYTLIWLARFGIWPTAIMVQRSFQQLLDSQSRFSRNLPDIAGTNAFVIRNDNAAV